MEPFSSDGNLGLLERAGFKDVMPIYRNMCFEGLVSSNETAHFDLAIPIRTVKDHSKI